MSRDLSKPQKSEEEVMQAEMVRKLREERLKLEREAEKAREEEEERKI